MNTHAVCRRFCMCFPYAPLVSVIGFFSQGYSYCGLQVTIHVCHVLGLRLQVTFVCHVPILFYGMVLRCGGRFVVSVRIYITLLLLLLLLFTR